MKQLTDPLQMTSLSPVARKKLDAYCKEKGWGLDTKDGFVPAPQLMIGQLIEFLLDTEHPEYLDAKQIGEGICDELWESVKEILEQKN